MFGEETTGVNAMITSLLLLNQTMIEDKRHL
jgi:hypothetical protein